MIFEYLRINILCLTWWLCPWVKLLQLLKDCWLYTANTNFDINFALSFEMLSYISTNIRTIYWRSCTMSTISQFWIGIFSVSCSTIMSPYGKWSLSFWIFWCALKQSRRCKWWVCIWSHNLQYMSYRAKTRGYEEILVGNDEAFFFSSWIIISRGRPPGTPLCLRRYCL